MEAPRLCASKAPHNRKLRTHKLFLLLWIAYEIFILLAGHSRTGSRVCLNSFLRAWPPIKVCHALENVGSPAGNSSLRHLSDATRTSSQKRMSEIVCNSRANCLRLELVEKALDNKTNNNETNAQDKYTTTITSQPTTTTTTTSDANQIALEQFLQDYSFNELEEQPQDDDHQLVHRNESTRSQVTSQQQLDNTSTSSEDEAQTLGGSGGSSPLVWLPAPPLPQLPPASAEHLGPTTSGRDKAAIRPNSADQSSHGNELVAQLQQQHSTEHSIHQPTPPQSRGQKVMIDQLNLGNRKLVNNYNNYSTAAAAAAKPTPLNGHSLLLPSFKQSPGAFPATPPGGGVGGGGVGGGPSELLLSRLHYSAMRQRQSQEVAAHESADYAIESLEPLGSLDKSNSRWGDLMASDAGPEALRNLSQLVSQVLRELQDKNVTATQSLVLRNNNIKFELWTQLYALLLLPMRTQLNHLDLSHNSLVKLGVTFTGYIEHHLVYQLMRSNNTDQTWPFVLPVAGQVNSTSGSGLGQNNSSVQQNESMYLNHSRQQQSSSFPVTGATSAKRLFRRPILGDGRVYNWVRQEHPLRLPAEVEHNKTDARESSQQLVELILHSPAQIRALDLSYNKLKWLINDQFRTLKHLQVLRLDHNRIRFIHQQAFSGLAGLKYLNLNFNKLQTIYMEQFQTNYNLLALFLRANFLTFLRAGALASQTQLKRLDLSRNKFTIMSNTALVGLESLEALNLSSNSFVHVPSGAFHPLVNSLKQLDMSDNQLTQLMPGAFFHLQIEQILLEDNDQLVSIDRGAFWDLPHLVHLSMRSSSQLLAINKQAFVGVPKLTQIDTRECPLIDSQTRQMLDNITTTNTMRSLLKQKAAQPEVATQNSTAQVNVTQPVAEVVIKTGNITNSSAEVSAARNETESGRKREPMSRLIEALEYQQQVSIQLRDNQTSATVKITKYFYSLGALTLLMVALKLVFKYTSTRHYLNLRRRRRRVYQTDGSSTEAKSDELTPSQSSSSRRNSLVSSSSCSQDSGESLPSSIQVFAMIEQQPRRDVIRRATELTSEVATEQQQLDAELTTTRNCGFLECPDCLLVAASQQSCSEQNCTTTTDETSETATDHNDQPLNCCDQTVGHEDEQVPIQAQSTITCTNTTTYDNDQLMHEQLLSLNLNLCDAINCAHCTSGQYDCCTQQSYAAPSYTQPK